MATLSFSDMDRLLRKAAAESDALKAENARFKRALEWYQEQLCEGVCLECPEHYYDIDCAGCKARAALTDRDIE